MSDLVERALLKIADDGYAIGCCLITDREARELARDIALEIAAMQTDAAPALKPAVEVADMIVAAANVTTCDGYYEVDIDTAAAVIEADRAAIIAAKDAEIVALKNTWQKQFDEKVRERGEAKLWFEKAQEWKQSLAPLQAHADALAKYAVHQPDCRIGKPDCLGEEELCTCGLSNAIRAYEEPRRG